MVRKIHLTIVIVFFILYVTISAFFKIIDGSGGFLTKWEVKPSFVHLENASIQEPCQLWAMGSNCNEEKGSIFTADPAWFTATQSFSEQSCQDIQKLVISNFPREHRHKPSKVALVFILPYDEQVDATHFMLLLRALIFLGFPSCFGSDSRQTQVLRTLTHLVHCHLGKNILSRSELVLPDHWSYLNAAHGCMRDLNSSFPTWNHVVVLPISAFPLKGSQYFASVSSLLGNANFFTAGSYDQQEYTDKFVYEHTLLTQTKGAVAPETIKVDFHTQNPPPPLGIRLYKGSMMAMLSRSFVSALLSDQRQNQKVAAWFKKTGGIEAFWSSLCLNVQLNIPGGYPGSCIRWQGIYQDRELNISVEASDLFDCNYGSLCYEVVRSSPALFANDIREEKDLKQKLCLSESLCRQEMGFDGSMTDEVRDTLRALPQVRYQHLANQKEFVCVENFNTVASHTTSV